ncbi:MAG: hypothetical protein LKK29_03390 [Olsenella sp.]|nr:hypothetical protein [Olsenella sp.]
MASCEMHKERRTPSPALGLFLDTCQWYAYLGVGYLVVWLCWLVPLALRITGPTPPADPAHELAQSGMAVVALSAVVSFAAVNGAFSWIYDRRAVQLYGMLPLRRGTIFLALILAGVVPLLVAVGISGFVFAAVLGFGQDAAAILPWIERHALLIVAFSGISAVCMQLAGRPVFALLCYLLVNFYAYAARQFAETLYGIVAPSVSWASVEGLGWASPFIQLMQLVSPWAITYPFPVPSLETALEQALVIYAIVGLACTALAMLAFSRRNLERAGDAYVSTVVRTVVNVLVSVLVGFAATDLVLATSLSNGYGIPAHVASMFYGVSPQLACLLPVAFSALVFAIAEAILGRGVKSLRTRIPALAITTGVALVASIVCVGSAVDAAAYVPNPADVRRATVSYVAMPFEDEKDVERVCRLHSVLASSVPAGDRPVPTSTNTETITYWMKDGTSLSRQYAIPLNDDGELDASSEVAQALKDLVDDPATEKALRSQVDAALLDESSSYVMLDYQEYSKDSQDDAPWHSEAISHRDYAALRKALTQDIDEHGAACAVALYQLTAGFYDSTGAYQYQTATGNLLGTSVETPYLANVSLHPTATPDEHAVGTTIYLSEGATPHTVAWLRSRYGLEFVGR